MPKSRPFKIIIDTNLWISFIISNKTNLLDNLLYDGKIRLLFSDELIKEIGATIAKPKFKKYFLPNAMEELLVSFEYYIDLVNVKSTINICRDPNDNFLLALAKDGNADFLITSDKDILELKKIGKTTITTITGFLSLTLD